jgi:tetratricopeptide (TPR) repeat protein
MRRSAGCVVIAVAGLTIGGAIAGSFGLPVGEGERYAYGAGKAKKEQPKDAATAPKAVPRDELSGFIVKAAEQAMKDRRYPLAISLWRGVVAIRGEDDDAMWKLSEAWTLAGDFDNAAEVLEVYAAATKDEVKRGKAREEIAALGRRERGFSSQTGLRLEPATKEAQEAFKRGRAAYKKKQYEVAALYFKAGIEMAPDLPGNYRELGESLDKLGRAKDAEEFFLKYLRQRPFGKNADEVRKRLAKSKLLVKMSLDSVLPCELVLIGPGWKGQDYQVVPKKLPLKDHQVAPGKYRVLCYSERYHMAYNEYVEVKPGSASIKVTFNFAVVVNKLDPWGRVVIEDPNKPGAMNDVGLFEEIGIPIPKDGRALKVRLTAGDNSKRKEELVKLAPGQRYELKW